MRCTVNGALGRPRRLPDDRARSGPAITLSRIIDCSNSLNTPSIPNSIRLGDAGERALAAGGRRSLWCAPRTGGGDPKPGPETSEVAFFAEHELPADLPTRRVLLSQLTRMFEHMRRPELPTEFD
jgi:hypothetical protein